MSLRSLALFALPLALLGSSAASATPTPEVQDGYLKLGFDLLASFKFIAPEYDPAANPKSPPVTGEEQIPAPVKSWNGKKAIVTGFMLPTKLDSSSGKARAVEFLLMANQMACCYGAVPNMNDWVIVKIPAGVPITQDIPISFRGTFKVNPAFESGYLTGIYELDAEGPGQIAQ